MEDVLLVYVVQTHGSLVGPTDDMVRYVVVVLLTLVDHYRQDISH